MRANPTCRLPRGRGCVIIVFQMFRLTRQERRLVAFILAAFLAGLAIKHWRETKEMKAAVAEMVQDP